MNQRENNPLITFVVPLYGKPNSVMKALIDKISVLSIPEVEFIIVYKNSDDYNYDWMHDYNLPNLKVIGPVKAEAQRTFKVITGAREAKGKWIQIFDAHHDFYAQILKKRVAELKELPDNYDLIVSSQRIIRRLKTGEEKTVWKTRAAWTSGIWNGTTLFKTELFVKHLDHFGVFNHSIGDDRTYPLVLFNYEPNLSIKFYRNEGYYKLMLYETEGINTTTGIGFNTKLYETMHHLLTYVAENTKRESYLKYFTFYYLMFMSFAHYNYMWKGKRAFFGTRRLILSTQLPRRVKWPILLLPWYLTSLSKSAKRYRIRAKIRRQNRSAIKNEKD